MPSSTFSAVLTVYTVLTCSSTQSKTTAIALDDPPNTRNSAAQLTAGFIIAPSVVSSTIL